MPIQKQDRRTQWTLDLPDDQWELARNATIKVTDQHGIYEATTGSDIEVNGDLPCSLHAALPARCVARAMPACASWARTRRWRSAATQ